MLARLVILRISTKIGSRLSSHELGLSIPFDSVVLKKIAGAGIFSDGMA